MAHLHLHLFI